MVYRPGANNPADYLSRHPLPRIGESHNHDELCTEEFVKMVVHDACPRAMTIEVIKKETETNANLLRTKAAIQQKQWK